MNYLKTIRVGFVMLVVFFAAAFFFTLLTSFAAGGDPDVPLVMITAEPYIHRIGSMDEDIYFNNSNGAYITAVIDISGTLPLTFTSAPAFDRPGEMYTYTTILDYPVLPYVIASSDGSQLGITYTVVNSNNLSATSLVNYIQDITPPSSTMTTPYGVITSATTLPLLLVGAITDTGSGIQSMEVNPGGTVYNQATLGSTGNHVTSTTWSYSWHIPTADGVGFIFLFRGKDNLGLTELAYTRVITVDNVAPEPITPTIMVHGVNLQITWPASTAPDTAGYLLTLYDGNNNSLITVNQPGTSYVYAGMVGQTYYARLRVYDNVGNLSPTESESNHVWVGAFNFLPLLVNP